MELNLLKEFLLSYSLPTVIIALIVGIVGFLTERFIKVKIPQFILTYAPFVISVIIYFAYNMIFVVKAFYFNTEVVYAGLLSGSLSVIIKETIKKLISGKRINLSATALLIEGLINGYVKNDALSSTAVLIEKIINKKDDQTKTTESVFATLKDNSTDIDEQDLLSLAALIIAAVTAIE